MKFIARIILIGGLAFALSSFLPWWGIAVSAAVVSFLLPGHGFSVFVSGFLGIGLLWLAYAWKTDIESGSIMSQKILQMFPIDDIGMLLVATGAIGGLVGGFSGLTGSSLRKIFMKKKQKSYYN